MNKKVMFELDKKREERNRVATKEQEAYFQVKEIEKRLEKNELMLRAVLQEMDESGDELLREIALDIYEELQTEDFT